MVKPGFAAVPPGSRRAKRANGCFLRRLALPSARGIGATDRQTDLPCQALRALVPQTDTMRGRGVHGLPSAREHCCHRQTDRQNATASVRPQVVEVEGSGTGDSPDDSATSSGGTGASGGSSAIRKRIKYVQPVSRSWECAVTLTDVTAASPPPPSAAAERISCLWAQRMMRPFAEAGPAPKPAPGQQHPTGAAPGRQVGHGTASRSAGRLHRSGAGTVCQAQVQSTAQSRRGASRLASAAVAPLGTLRSATRRPAPARCPPDLALRGGAAADAAGLQQQDAKGAAPGGFGRLWPMTEPMGYTWSCLACRTGHLELCLTAIDRPGTVRSHRSTRRADAAPRATDPCSFVCYSSMRLLLGPMRACVCASVGLCSGHRIERAAAAVGALRGVCRGQGQLPQSSDVRAARAAAADVASFTQQPVFRGLGASVCLPACLPACLATCSLVRRYVRGTLLGFR
jgi:hypothetical protein